MCLREGVYYLSETIELNNLDNNLTIKAYQAENVRISGGIPLNNLHFTRKEA